MLELGFPSRRSEANSWINMIGYPWPLLDIKPRPAGIDIWHRFSPYRNLRVWCRAEKRSGLQSHGSWRRAFAYHGVESRCTPEPPRADRRLPQVSESEPALSTKAPVNCAVWKHDAGDLATELLFQAGRQGTSWKPRPSSITANRPELSVIRWRRSRRRAHLL